MKNKMLVLALFFAFGSLQSILGMGSNAAFETICDRVERLQDSGKDVKAGLEELTKDFDIHFIERTDVFVDGVKRSQTQSLLSWAIINKKEAFINWLIDDKECDVNTGWGYTADEAVSKKVSTHYYVSPLYAALETKNFELAKKAYQTSTLCGKFWLHSHRDINRRSGQRNLNRPFILRWILILRG